MLNKYLYGDVYLILINSYWNSQLSHEKLNTYSKSNKIRIFNGWVNIKSSLNVYPTVIVDK